MSYTQRGLWQTVTYYDNGITLTRSNAIKLGIDLGLMAAGGALCWGLGNIAGKVLEHIPYVSQWIPQAVDFVSGIDVKNNIHGLCGLLGCLYGIGKSGTKAIKGNPDLLHKVTLAPVTLTLRK